MIIRTSSNELYSVKETGDANLSHVWEGIRVKVKDLQFVPVKNAKPQLVRKAATVLVQA